MHETNQPLDWKTDLEKLKTPEDFLGFLEAVNQAELSPELKLERLNELYKKINRVEAELEPIFLTNEDVQKRIDAGDVLTLLLEIKVKITNAAVAVVKPAQT